MSSPLLLGSYLNIKKVWKSHLELENHISKGTLFSSILKVEEGTVPLVFCLGQNWQSYGYIDYFGAFPLCNPFWPSLAGEDIDIFLKF